MEAAIAPRDEPAAGVAARAVMTAIRFYQLTISPSLPASCRFVPSCSEYTRQAVGRHGTIRGLWMGVRRIARCHPFHPGGFDPVDRA